MNAPFHAPTVEECERRPLARWCLLSLLWLLVPNLGLASAATPADRPVLRIVYFIPADREREPDYRDRLERVMTEVQRFYRVGMERNGYGPLSFELERDDQGKLMFHEVRGRLPMRDYGRDDASKVRAEVRETLAARQIDIDRETIVIFQLLLEWNGDRATEVGPYVGSGGPRSGTAWVYDDARLDPRLLSSTEPGGWYHGACSLGQFNTHYIGGVAHELGHGLGLPHDCESDADRLGRGRSLMGSGNHTYGEEQRGQGKGSFLSAASALPLSVHPLFTGRRAAAAEMACQLADLEASQDGPELTLRGRFEGVPRALGLVARNDSEAVPADYDAVGWICPVDGAGRFCLVVGELKPGPFDLRIDVYGESGDSRSFSIAYRVNQDGEADLEPFAETVWLRRALAAYQSGSRQQLESIRVDLNQRFPSDSRLVRKVAHLQALSTPSALVDPDTLPSKSTTVRLADLKLESAEVGWGRPLRNQVMTEGQEDCLLEVGGAFFESGFFAHAPARHALQVPERWNRLNTRFGLQDGHDGSVVFVIIGDGRELYRSDVVRDHRVREQTIPISGVKRLELLVEDAGDGRARDWGVWLDPRLER